MRYVGVVIGLILLVAVHIHTNRPAIVIDFDKEPEINIPGQFCENVKLGNPGGLSFNIAMVCVNGEFEIATNTGHLTDEKYNELIQPVLDSLHAEARKAGINTQSRNGYVR